MVDFVYVDSCVFIQYLATEEFSNNLAESDYAKKFFEYCIKKKVIVYSSPVIVTELEKIVGQDFRERFAWLFSRLKISDLEITTEVLAESKKLCDENYHLIGINDAISLVLSKKYGLILITNDKKMFSVANQIKVSVLRPKDLV
jgi:predicted nucleic acid-binding protein